MPSLLVHGIAVAVGVSLSLFCLYAAGERDEKLVCEGEMGLTTHNSHVKESCAVSDDVTSMNEIPRPTASTACALCSQDEMLLFPPRTVLFVPVKSMSWTILSHPEISKKTRRRRRMASGQVHLETEYNPTLPNHCLFECFASVLLPYFESKDAVSKLRLLTVALWQQQQEEPVLGLNLTQVAKSCGKTRQAYLAALQRSQWGGFREAYLLAKHFGRALTIWQSNGKIIVMRPAIAPQVHLVYTGSHYYVAKNSMKLHLAVVREWCMKSLHTCGTGKGGGENAAAIRAKLTQKLAKSGCTSDPAKVISELWKLDKESLKTIRGNQEEVQHQIMQMCQANGIHLKDFSGAEGDRLWEQDPWSRGSRSQASTAIKRDTDIDPQKKMDQVEIKTAFVDNSGSEIPRKSYDDLLAAEGAKINLLTCISPGVQQKAFEVANSIKGSVVLMMRHQPVIPAGATYAPIQAVTKANATSEWKASRWHMLTFGDHPVEATLQGIQLKLADGAAVAMVARLNEEHTQEQDFMRFAKAESLEQLCGLTKQIFPIEQSKQWGYSPWRIAIKKAMVIQKNLHMVLNASGRSQVSLVFELGAEERAHGHATHVVYENDSEAVRTKLSAVTHLGVIHLANQRCLVRVPREHLAAVRQTLSPMDPRFSLAPELHITSKWRVLGVPLRVSPLRLSEALLRQMSWRQVPIASVRREPKKDIHQIIIGSDKSPPAEVVIIEAAVCIIKPERPLMETALPQPRVVPVEMKASDGMEEESTLACAKVLTNKVELEVRCAGESIKTMAQKQIETTTQGLEQKIGAAVEERLETLNKRLAEVEKMGASVSQLVADSANSAAAIQQLQKTQAELEPKIEAKLMQATETTAQQLATTLNSKFDELGKQLFQQISSMAKKRDAEDVDMHAKLPRGPGGGRKTKKRKLLHRKPAANQEGLMQQRDAEAEVPCPSTDLDEEELTAGLHLLQLQSFPKGRRTWKMWPAEDSNLREVYWDFGRAAKRGVGRFTIYSHTGDYIPLATRVSEIPSDKILRVVSEQWTGDSMLELQGLEEHMLHGPQRHALPTDNDDDDDAQLEHQDMVQRLHALELKVSRLERMVEELMPRGPALQQGHQALLGLGGMLSVSCPKESLEGHDGCSPSDRPSGPDSAWASRIAGIFQNSAVPSLSEDPTVPVPDASADPVLKLESQVVGSPASASDLRGAQGWIRCEQLELPKLKHKFFLEMQEHVSRTDARQHVFTVAKDGVVHIPDGSSLRDHLQPEHTITGHMGWRAMCLKCGVVVELKRWRQYSQWACRRVAKRSMQPSMPKPPVSPWATIDNAVDLLEEHARQGKSLTGTQRRTMSRLAIATNVLMNRGSSSDTASGGSSSALRVGLPPVNELGRGGQSLRIASLNIGTLQGRIEAVHEMANLVALQETMVSTHHLRSVQGEAKAYQMTYAAGISATQKKDCLGRTQTVKGQGLGVLYDKNLEWQGLRKHYARGTPPSRRLHSGWVVGMGVAFVLHNVYAVTGRQQAAGAENSELFQELIWRVQESPSKMQVILGDLQAKIEDVIQLRPLLDLGWLPASAWPTIGDAPTNFPPIGAPRQLDTVIVAPDLAPLVRHCEIVPTYHLSTHHGVCITLEVEAQRSWGWSLNARVDVTEHQDFRGPSSEEWEEIWSHTRQDASYYERVAACMNEWYAWYLPSRATRASLDIGKVSMSWKQLSGVSDRRLRTPISGSGWRVHVLKKALGHAQELYALASRRFWGYHEGLRYETLVRKLWNFPWDKLWVGDVWDLLTMHSWDRLWSLLQTSLWNIQESRVQVLAVWKCRLRQALRLNVRKACRWVKEPVASLSAVMVDGEPTSDPMIVSSEIARAWRPIFVHSEEWTGMGMTASSDDGAPYPLEQIQAADLISACKKEERGICGG